MNYAKVSGALVGVLAACASVPATAAESTSAAIIAPTPANAPQFGALQLFNGRNLDGLHVFLADPKADPTKTWTVQDGILRTTGTPYGYIRTQIAYADYKLHVEWRWPDKGGNSGVVMHIVNRDEVWPKGFEVNMLTGQAGTFALFWDARSKEESIGRIAGRFSTGRLERRANVEKPLGQWNALDVVASGDTITVTVNGVEVNRMTEVNPSGGMVALQAEGTPVEFRNWTLTPLAPLKDLVKPVPGPSP